MVTWASTVSSQSPLSLPPVSSLYLHPASFSCPGPSVCSSKGNLTEAPDDPCHCFLGQKTRDQGSRGPVHYIPAQSRLPCKVVQVGYCTRALPTGITDHIIDMAKLYIYYDNFLAGGGQVS